MVVGVRMDVLEVGLYVLKVAMLSFCSMGLVEMEVLVRGRSSKRRILFLF